MSEYSGLGGERTRRGEEVFIFRDKGDEETLKRPFSEDFSVPFFCAEKTDKIHIKEGRTELIVVDTFLTS